MPERVSHIHRFQSLLQPAYVKAKGSYCTSPLSSRPASHFMSKGPATELFCMQMPPGRT